MKTQLILIRHGRIRKTRFPEESTPLSPKGVQEILRLVLFEFLPIPDIIFSSPFLRARQTAEILANHYNQQVHIIEDLKERKISTRSLSDNEFDEYKHRSWGDPDWFLPGGESLTQAQDRIISCIRDRISANLGKTIYLVSHGTILSLFWVYLLGTFPQVHFHDEILTGARAIIEWENNEFKIINPFELPKK